jgi:hypothetical protein
VPVPKWLLAGIGLLAVFLIGGMLRATMADGSRTTEVGPADPSLPAPVAPPGQSAAPPVYVQIVLAEAPVSPAAPAVGAVGTTANGHAVRVPMQSARPRTILVPSSRRPVTSASSWRTLTSPSSWRTLTSASAPTQMRRLGDVASASAPTLVIMTNAPQGPAPTQTVGQTSSTPTVSGTADLQSTAAANGLSIIANGNQIVIANNGSIVSVGDNTVLTANTGDAGASGVIALDVVDSAVTSGTSTVSGWPDGSPGPSQGAPAGTQENVSTAATSSASASGGPGTRAVAIDGYQNRTITVVGNDNLLTKEDSNIFYQRAGHLNGNTGDTDSSGLNVVDATGSLVRSGNSSAPPDPAPVDQASTVPSPAAVAATPAPGAASASVAGPNGTATATGADSLAIGGPGVVDTSMQVLGDRNITTSDDGNVTVGGVGNVNAQVGDSDTSGAVVMDVTGSEITSGNSVPPAGPPPPSPSTADPTMPPPTLPPPTMPPPTMPPPTMP